MMRVDPATLQLNGVCLEPLVRHRADGRRAV